MTYYMYPAYRYRAVVIKVHYVKIIIIKKNVNSWSNKNGVTSLKT